MISLTLPVPPSANGYWRNVTIQGRPRVLLSKRGREYKQAVRGIALSERVQRYGAHVRLEVRMTVHFQTKRRADIDNLLKGALDSLKGLAFVDDEQVDRIVLQRGGVDKGDPRIEVTILPINALTREAA